VTFNPDGPSARIALDLRDAARPAVTADTVTGTLAISPRPVEDMPLALTRNDPRGGGRLDLSGRIPLEEPGRPAQPLALTVDADAWPVAGLTYFLPEAVAGPGFLDGRVTG